MAFECRFHQQEYMFVGGISFSLIRQAAMAGMGAEQLLANVLRPLRGMLQSHLAPTNANDCRKHMTDALRRRLNGVECPDVGVILKAATDGNLDPDQSSHVGRCSLCRRDIAWIRGRQLPSYDEFNRDL